MSDFEFNNIYYSFNCNLNYKMKKDLNKKVLVNTKM